MIVKSGNKWLLKTKDKKRILGVHNTKKAAQKQERAINISKAKHKY